MVTEIRDGSSNLRFWSGHTAELGPSELQRTRELLDHVFAGDFSEADWQHALGGVHVLAWRDELLLGHAAVVQRHLIYGGRALSTGYVEALGVHPDHRRHGLAGKMMEVLEGVIARAFQIGALSATETAALLYRQRGWRAWQGPLSVLTPQGVVPTPDEEGGIFVFPMGYPLDVSQPLVADFRDGDVW